MFDLSSPAPASLAIAFEAFVEAHRAAAASDDVAQIEAVYPAWHRVMDFPATSAHDCAVKARALILYRGVAGGWALDQINDDDFPRVAQLIEEISAFVSSS